MRDMDVVRRNEAARREGEGRIPPIHIKTNVFLFKTPIPSETFPITGLADGLLSFCDIALYDPVAYPMRQLQIVYISKVSAFV